MTHSTHLPAAPAKKNGRPLKNDPPRLPHHEVDRLLVHGELVEGEDGAPTTVVYPSYRDLARRYGVNHSVVAAYAKKHNCLHRREVAQARVSARSDEKLIEQRAAALAFGRAEVMRIIDRYIGAFEAALTDGRVRCDNPTDFNTMLRLKEYLDGGPDSRKEVTAGITLEALQARYEAAMARERLETDRMKGIVPVRIYDRDDDHAQARRPPARRFEDAPQEVADDADDELDEGDDDAENAPDAKTAAMS